METLEQRIEARLIEALDRQAAAEFSLLDEDRGLCDWDGGSHTWRPRLSVADVARIAAAEARAWL